jgi:YidC/Oxa1 family membrane protein insertase
MKEMSDEQRLLVAFLLMVVILVVWQKFYKPPVPPPETRNVATSSATTTPAPGQTAATTMAKIVPPPAGGVQASSEQTVTIENSLYQVEFSNRGAVVRSWKLKKYLNDEKPPKPLDLVNSSAAQQIGAWPLSLALDDPSLEAAANSGLYQVTVHGGAGTVIQAPADLTFHWSDGHLDVTKTLKFDADYQVELEASANVDGHPLPAGIGWRGGFGDIDVAQQSQNVTVYYRENGKLNLLPVKKLGASGHPEVRALQTGTLEYTGIQDQFFTAAFLADGAGLNLWDWVQQHDIQSNGSTSQEPEAQMAAGTAVPGPLKMRLYVGPKDFHILGTVKPPLDDLVQFGWFGIIAKPLLEVLLWTHKYVPNWGWAIVLLTLVINVALFPLKVKNWRAMKNMQRVAPEMNNIQNRYKKYGMNDPRKRKMNEEIMALYQREGINPFGSCLPMLVQFPFLLAFYRMLGGAIELRHAPWFGWIHDLSAHDPYYILPIVMMASMFLMQKMTPMTTADPAQQKMMNFMPLVFGFIFFRLSSGLNLYYFTSNVVGIAQQYYLVKTDPLPAKSGGKNNNKK